MPPLEAREDTPTHTPTAMYLMVVKAIIGGEESIAYPTDLPLRLKGVSQQCHLYNKCAAIGTGEMLEGTCTQYRLKRPK